jgi:hypothetical protein
MKAYYGRRPEAPKEGQMTKSRLKVSDPKVLIGISVFFILIGGMAMNPAVSFICFVLAGILALITVLRGTRRLRYIAFFLLIIIIALAVLRFPEASRHLKVYKSKTVNGGVR